MITTHFDCDTINDTLVKLDILGHDDPTVLRMLQELTGVDVRSVPIDDPRPSSSFSGLESLGIDPKDASGEVGTLAIPEFGTRFVRQMSSRHGLQAWANSCASPASHTGLTCGRGMHKS